MSECRALAIHIPLPSRFQVQGGASKGLHEQWYLTGHAGLMPCPHQRDAIFRNLHCPQQNQQCIQYLHIFQVAEVAASYNEHSPAKNCRCCVQGELGPLVPPIVTGHFLSPCACLKNMIIVIAGLSNAPRLHLSTLSRKALTVIRLVLQLSYLSLDLGSIRWPSLIALRNVKSSLKEGAGLELCTAIYGV